MASEGDWRASSGGWKDGDGDDGFSIKNCVFLFFYIQWGFIMIILHREYNSKRFQLPNP